MLSDHELAQLFQLRESPAAAPGATASQLVGAAYGAAGLTSHRPRSGSSYGSSGPAADPAQRNFTAVAHLFHSNSNRSSVAWEAGLRR